MKPKKGVPAEYGSTLDEKIRLSAVLEKGDGRYKKGFFTKKGMVNFIIKVSIDNPDDLKIKSVIAYLKCGQNSHKKSLPVTPDSLTEIDLETSKFSGNITATVEAVYKIGPGKTKTIKTTISKNF